MSQVHGSDLHMSQLSGCLDAGMRVTILDGRQIVGRCTIALPLHHVRCQGFCRWHNTRFVLKCRFMAFDRHMNLVLGDSEEFRKLPPKKGKSDDEVSLPCQASFKKNEKPLVLSAATEL